MNHTLSLVKTARADQWNYTGREYLLIENAGLQMKLFLRPEEQGKESMTVVEVKRKFNAWLALKLGDIL